MLKTLILAASLVVFVIFSCSCKSSSVSTVTPTATTRSSTIPVIPSTPAPSVSSSPIPPALTQEIATESISAMEKVNSYQSVTNTTSKYDVFQNTETTEENTTINSDMLVDITHQEMKIDDSYLVTDNKGNIFGSKPSSEWYIFGGWEYAKNNNNNTWTKVKLSDEVWATENQITWPIKLLNTAAGVTIKGDETINGIDCYVLNITPSPGVIADWVEFLYQETGRLDYSSVPSLTGRDNLIKTYKSGLFEFGISKDNHLVIGVNFQAHFEATPKDLGVTSQTRPQPQFNKITLDSNIQMTFPVYNQPVNIQLPPEALNATEK